MVKIHNETTKQSYRWFISIGNSQPNCLQPMAEKKSDRFMAAIGMVTRWQPHLEKTKIMFSELKGPLCGQTYKVTQLEIPASLQVITSVQNGKWGNSTTLSPRITTLTSQTQFAGHFYYLNVTEMSGLFNIVISATSMKAFGLCLTWFVIMSHQL